MIEGPQDGRSTEGSARARGEELSARVSLSSEMVQRLLEFRALLAERAVPLGLIAEGDADRIWERHVLDSARAIACVGARDTLVRDLGSGAGLPGMVVAVGCPTARVELIEARRRRAAFLELAVERLGLDNVVVTARRAEDVVGPGDACLARAFAPLDRSWARALPLLHSGGRLVYFAGAAGEIAPDLPHASRASPAHVEVEVPSAGVIAFPNPLVIITRQ